ncbi:unnamed protein product [Arabis nemorensis]|uniref:Pentacotripeptide-repeat region of PRORP domain-containing protein n=1 Tax=Arabis nemorensis TaxID=586526 RepID=A0A565BCN6_9BRAS|nr:unnamed protein product [Arabis nemorensis]
MSSSSRRFILQRMRMTSSAKPYPIGRDHPRKQRLDDLRSNSRPLLSLIVQRVQFLINNISDLDTAAKHARLVVNKKVDPERAIPICTTIIGAMCCAKRSDDALDLFHFFFNESKMEPNIASCNLMIKSHCEEGRLDDALRLYSHLSYNTPRPDHNTYDLWICC